MKPVTMVIIGAGSRGRAYARYALDHPEQLQIAAGGHAGGDEALMKAFVAAVANNDPSYILSGPDETMESHQMVFAAEQARRENCVISLKCNKKRGEDNP